MKKIAIPIQNLPGAKKALMPTAIQPELCKTLSLPHGENWLHEIKFDGYRIITFIKNQKVKLYSRNQKDWTDKFPGIAKHLKQISQKDTILDGELVALNQQGISEFQLLQNALENQQQVKLAYYIFDILFYNGYNLTHVALLQRKQLLQTLFENWHHKPSNILYSDHVIGQGEIFFKNVCEHGLEGIISKRIESFYQQKRSKGWIKSKCLRQQEFVIGGFTDPEGARKYFGALLLGYYDKQNQLKYCGHVGTGFNEKNLKKLYQLLQTDEPQPSPFINSPPFKNVHWVKPTLVAEIKFLEWTEDCILRQPVFLGLRMDKKSQDVKSEITIQKKDSPKDSVIAGVTISHPDKIVYKEPAISKFKIASYYEKVARWILPHISNRFLTLLRCPDGITAGCFYQKHLTEKIPSSILTDKIKENEEPYISIENIAGLITLAQLNVLEIHPWGSSMDNFDKPDRIIFDIDPGEKVTWQEVIQCALLLREELQRINLESFIKTTGGKGLHVIVPMVATINWKQASTFARIIAEHLVDINPEKYLATMSKTQRVNKIYIDYLRNKQGATAIAPYGLRARPGAPVATPISWRELPRIQSSTQFTLLNIEQRLKRLKKDPWEGFFKIQQRIR